MITAFEAKHSIRFQSDYRAFLRSTGGLFIYEDPSAVEETTEIWQEWPFQTDTFDGLKTDFTCFFDPKFLRIGYVVGSDLCGNPLMQLTAGRFAGKIAMLDHEVFYGGMDQILEITNWHYPKEPDQKATFETFEFATDEQVIEECIKYESLVVFDMTFGEFILELNKLHTAAYLDRIRN